VNTLDFSALPSPLQSPISNHWQDFLQRLQDQQLSLDNTLPPLTQLPKVWAASDFVVQYCLRQPQAFLELLASGDLQRDYADDEYLQRLRKLSDSCASSQQLGTVVRQFRNREMVRIAWRDISDLSSLLQILRELSLLADACVQIGCEKLYSWLTADFGTPLRDDGQPMQLVILGMGKLGAYELNYSSDIDLIFCFAHEGQTQGGRRSQTHAEFFVRLCRQLMVLLDENTADGFVFRTDARLRPFGEVSQLALSFDAMENYYETHGRDWERYAMVKARVIFGAADDAADLMARLKPFVYRRYLDYSSFESLREMKEMINAETRRKGLEQNVKTGAGGIREVEFITQAFQLIRGGREPRLQKRELMQVLPIIAQMQLLPEFVVQRLLSAYEFLRRCENRIQAFQDKQTHSLPSDPLVQLRLAVAMNFADWPTFMRKLDEHRALVHEHFQQVFASPQTQTTAQPDARRQKLQNLWSGQHDREQEHAILTDIGFADAAQAWQILEDTRNSSACRNMGPRGQKRMEALMPMLLPAIGRTAAPLDCLRRIAELIIAIARRTAYLDLLVEHPLALSQLVRLCAISPWIAEQLSRFPILLDELLDPRRLYEAMPKPVLVEELNTRLAHIAHDDVELRMDILRQFKLANVLRVAAAELTDALPVEKVSDHLTFIAEACLEQTLASAEEQLQQKHGRPRYRWQDRQHSAGFGIIAYGKLGGLELGFGSDLDVVFLHDSRGEEQATDGAKSLDNAVYFARLGQRITSLLSTHTATGILYDVDTRLRPSGGAGLLVSSIDAYYQYQQKEAWVWEHQALVRARPIVGSPAILQRFKKIRHETLCLERDPTKLRDEVVNMRQRMRQELDKSSADSFELKQGLGGIVDIEFIIQFMVLRFAHQHPQLTDWPDNLRIIETACQTKLLPADDAKMLQSAYLAFRHRAHQLALQRERGFVPNDQFQDYREGVCRIWQRLLS